MVASFSSVKKFAWIEVAGLLLAGCCCGEVRILGRGFAPALAVLDDGRVAIFYDVREVADGPQQACAALLSPAGHLTDEQRLPLVGEFVTDEPGNDLYARWAEPVSEGVLVTTAGAHSGLLEGTLWRSGPDGALTLQQRVWTRAEPEARTWPLAWVGTPRPTTAEALYLEVPCAGCERVRLGYRHLAAAGTVPGALVGTPGWSRSLTEVTVLWDRFRWWVGGPAGVLGLERGDQAFVVVWSDRAVSTVAFTDPWGWDGERLLVVSEGRLRVWGPGATESVALPAAAVPDWPFVGRCADERPERCLYLADTSSWPYEGRLVLVDWEHAVVRVVEVRAVAAEGALPADAGYLGEPATLLAANVALAPDGSWFQVVWPVLGPLEEVEDDVFNRYLALYVSERLSFTDPLERLVLRRAW